MGHFSDRELNCRHCGKAGIKSALLAAMERLRATTGPITITNTSGYRCPQHPVEAKKAKPGTGMHCLGLAADLNCPGMPIDQFFQAIAARPEFHGIGLSREQNFIHVDTRPAPRIMWWYRKGRDVVSNNPLADSH